MSELTLSTDVLGLSANTFSGRVAVVTGAGRGIGKETAMVLAGLGASVAIAEIDPHNGTQVASDILESGGHALFVRTDVSDPTSVSHLKEIIGNLWGPVDIVVNNAICCPVKPFLELSLEEWDKTIGVNLRGAFLCIREFLPQMAEVGSGCVVSLTSAQVMPYMGSYIASKEALRALSASVAGEFIDTGIHIVSYSPGMVETPGGTDAFKELASFYEMGYEQFTKSGINPGYEGLMPASDTAVLLAYLIEHSEEYHGDNVTAGDLLERLGFLAQTAVINQGDPYGTKVASEVSASSVQEMWKSVHTDLLVTSAEFNKLPFFVRSMARSGFKTKAILSLTNWLRKAEELSLSADQNGIPMPGGDVGHTVEALRGLAKYYREAPGEASRFVKDAALMAEMMDKSRLREDRVLTLLTRLSGLERP